MGLRYDNAVEGRDDGVICITTYEEQRDIIIYFLLGYG